MRLQKASWRVARAVVVAAVAAAVYLVLIPQTQVKHNELGRLVVTHTSVAGVPAKAKLAEWVDPSKSTFSVTRQAARRDPNHTGLYAREWYITPEAPPEVGIVLQLLPDAVSARAAQEKVAGDLLTAPQLSNLKAGAGQRFPIPGVPGGRGSAFPLTDTAGATKGIVAYAYKTVYRVDDAVLTELITSSGTTSDTRAAVADAQAEYRLLSARAAGFSFAHTHLPTVATIVYSIVTAVAMAGAVVLPEWAVVLVHRRRERRLARAHARERQQYLARGRRTVRRHGAPPWAKSKRR
jgi:lysylphosphatidylglycerol synthetase-like protein (DUF2156 family)